MSSDSDVLFANHEQNRSSLFVIFNEKEFIFLKHPNEFRDYVSSFLIHLTSHPKYQVIRYIFS